MTHGKLLLTFVRHGEEHLSKRPEQFDDENLARVSFRLRLIEKRDVEVLDYLKREMLRGFSKSSIFKDLIYRGLESVRNNERRSRRKDNDSAGSGGGI